MRENNGEERGAHKVLLSACFPPPFASHTQPQVLLTRTQVHKTHTQMAGITSTLDPALVERARAQQAVEHSLSKFQAFTVYKKATFWMAIAILFVVTSGYENYAAGSVISIGRFRQDFGFWSEASGQYALDARWQSAINGGPQASLVAGLLVGSMVADRVGRKPVIVGCILMMIPGVIMQCVATSIQMFFGGKFFCTFFMGAVLTVANSYIGEIAPLALRGAATATVNLALTFSHLVVLIVIERTRMRSDRWAYRAVFVSQCALIATSMCFIAFIPESPYWLITHGKDAQAKRQLSKIFSAEEQAESQYAIIKVTVEEARLLNAEHSRFREMFKGTNARRTFIAAFLFFMQAQSGISFVSTYSTYYYELSGYEEGEAFKISIGGVTLACVGVVVSWFLLDRFGRRTLMLWGCAVVAVDNFLIAILGMYTDRPAMIKASAAFMTLFYLVYNVSFGALAYVFAIEAPTNKLRAKTAAFSTAMNNAFQCMWAFVIPYMFNTDEANMGSKINFIFFGCCVVAWGVFFFHLPEFAGRSYEELDEMFAERVPARKFSSYVCTVQLAHTSDITAAHDLDLTKTEVEQVEYVQEK